MNRRQPVRFTPTPLPTQPAQRPDPTEPDNVYAVKRRPGARLEQIALVSQAAKNYCGDSSTASSRPSARASTNRREDEAQQGGSARCAGCKCCASRGVVKGENAPPGRREWGAEPHTESDSEDLDHLDEIIRGLQRTKTRGR